MLNLIKNELYKILNKKTTYILLGLIVLYSIFINFIYTKTNTYEYYDSYDFYDVSYCRENLKVDEHDSYCKSIVDAKEQQDKYSKDSWQYIIIPKVYVNIASNYYSSFENSKEAKEKYDGIKEALEKDDWKYVVNIEIEDVKKQIATQEEYIDKNDMKEEELKSVKISLFTLKEQLSTLEYRLNKEVPYGNDYINEAINSINNLSYDVGTYNESSDKDKKNYESDVKEFYQNKYILDTKEDINNEQTLRYMFIGFFDTYNFWILLFIIMIAGGIVSDEFNKGTIKSLLITPYKRTTILLSKFLSIILMTMIVVVFTSIIQLIVGAIFFGVSSLSIPVVYYNLSTMTIETIGLFKYLLIEFMAILPKIILLATLAFSVSTIINNTAISVVIPLCGIFAADIINEFATYERMEYLHYFVTTNWNFNYYIFGNVSPYGLTLTHSIVVCLVYFIIMLLTSFIVFKKKNIKNI